MADRAPTVRDSFRNWDSVRLELEQVLSRVDAATFEWKPVASTAAGARNGNAAGAITNNVAGAENVKSIGDLVRHLCDSEAYWIERVIQGKDWLRHTREVWSDHEALLERWKILRQRTLQFLDSLSTARLSDTKIDHRGNIVTVEWILWHVFQHEAHHRGQIYMILRLHRPDRTSLTD